MTAVRFDVERMREAYRVPEGAEGRHPEGSFVRVNVVSSLDGSATLDGRSGTLGDAEDQRLMSVLRALADVVLVGSGTVEAEGYGGAGVTDADAAWRESIGLPSQPRFAVVSSRLGLSADHPFFAEARARPLVVTSAGSPAARRRELEAVAEVVVAGEDRVDLCVALAEIAARGLPSVLCEGGPGLFGELIAADLVDETCVSLSPMLVGGAATRVAASARETARELRLMHAIEGERMLFLRHARP